MVLLANKALKVARPVAVLRREVPHFVEAGDMIKDAADKGYEVSANLMAASTVTDTEMDQVLEVIAQTPASTLVSKPSASTFAARASAFAPRRIAGRRVRMTDSDQSSIGPLITGS